MCRRDFGSLPFAVEKGGRLSTPVRASRLFIRPKSSGKNCSFERLHHAFEMARTSFPVLHVNKVSIDLDNRAIDARVRLIRVSIPFQGSDSRTVSAGVPTIGARTPSIGAGKLFLRSFGSDA
jgi:hypothetical protein